jgi:bile acid:Na+ symporter, BASS family
VVEFLEIVANIAVLVFVVTCMTTAGLGLGVRDVVGPLRSSRLLIVALTVNFLVAPTAAWGLTRIFALDTPYATGLILLSAAAGAPFLPKLAELAKGDVAYSVGLMLLLTVGTVVSLPILLPMLIPGQSADAWPILRSLLLTMLLPLTLGMLVRNRRNLWASRLRPALGLISNVSMLLAILLLVGLNVQDMLNMLGSGAVAVAALFISLLLVAGLAFGGPEGATRSVLGLGTAQRNVAAAMIVATQNSSDAKVVVMLIASTLAGLVVLVPAAFWFSRRSGVAHNGRVNPAHVTKSEEVLR